MLMNTKRDFYRNGKTINGLIKVADTFLQHYEDKMGDRSVSGTIRTLRRDPTKVKDFSTLKELRYILEELWKYDEEDDRKRTLGQLIQDTSVLLGIPMDEILSKQKEDKAFLKTKYPEIDGMTINQAAFEDVLFPMVVYALHKLIMKYRERGYGSAQEIEVDDENEGTFSRATKTLSRALRQSVLNQDMYKPLTLSRGIRNTRTMEGGRRRSSRRKKSAKRRSHPRHRRSGKRNSYSKHRSSMKQKYKSRRRSRH